MVSGPNTEKKKTFNVNIYSLMSFLIHLHEKKRILNGNVPTKVDGIKEMTSK